MTPPDATPESIRYLAFLLASTDAPEQEIILPRETVADIYATYKTLVRTYTEDVATYRAALEMIRSLANKRTIVNEAKLNLIRDQTREALRVRPPLVQTKPQPTDAGEK